MIDEVYDTFLEDYQIQSCRALIIRLMAFQGLFFLQEKEMCILRNQLIVQFIGSQRYIIS